MKTIRIILPLFLAMLIAGKAGAQGSLVVFSEKGEKFTLYLNGSPVTESPAPRAETNRPMGPSFKFRLSFEDSAIPEISKTVFNSPGPEMFYVVRKTEKGKYILEKTASEYVHHDAEKSAEPSAGTEKKAAPASSGEKKEQAAAGGETKGCSGPMEMPTLFIAPSASA